jgi:hypothetical protein
MTESINDLQQRRDLVSARARAKLDEFLEKDFADAAQRHGAMRNYNDRIARFMDGYFYEGEFMAALFDFASRCMHNPGMLCALIEEEPDLVLTWDSTQKMTLLDGAMCSYYNNACSIEISYLILDMAGDLLCSTMLQSGVRSAILCIQPLIALRLMSFPAFPVKEQISLEPHHKEYIENRKLAKETLHVVNGRISIFFMVAKTLRPSRHPWLTCDCIRLVLRFLPQASV